MLTIFTGTDQGKKLHEMAKIADQAAAADKDSLRQNLLWLTPDQFTFETERDLLHRLQPPTRCKMTVTGFLRFSDRILKQFGGAAVRHADNLCKLILMRRALADCRDLLQSYGGLSQTGDLQFEEELLAFVRQLKFAGITPQQLSDAGKQKRIAENLRAKAADLAQIAMYYEMRLSESWRDSLDDISAANQKLMEREEQGKRYFAGMTVFFDGFKSFTAPQYDMIRLMLRQGAAVYVSLQLDRKQAQSELHSIFAVTLDTYDRLLSLAGGHCEEQSYMPKMPENALDAVKQGLFFDPVVSFPADQSVQLYCCRDEYAEAEFCFGRIKAMIKDGDLRYRDIAVVYRNESDYLLPIAAAAQKFEVPYCVDGGEQPQNQGLFYVCTALLRSAYQRFDAADLLCIAKSGLFPADEVELAELSEYLEVWGPQSLDDWQRPFTAKLSGYETVEFGEETPLGEAPELLRQKLLGLLTPLRKVQSATGREYGAVLYDTLEKSGILAQFAAQVESEPELERQMQLKRVWNSFGDILTRLSDMLADEKITGNTYYRLFLQSVKETKIKAVVQTMDCVLIGSADAVRLREPKVLWILGANDGIFPKRPGGRNGLFSESEYQQFAAMDLVIGKTLEERIDEERFTACQMIAAPTEKLIVSFRAADLGGVKQLPGEIVWRLSTMLSLSAQKGILSEREWMTTPQAAFDAYCRYARNDPENASKYRDLLSKLPGAPYAERLAAVENLLHPKRYLLSGKETIDSLYALYERMLSPSEIEQYFDCPFAYYVKYGLKLRVKERAAYNPLLRGNIVHRVIAALTLPLSDKAKADAAEAAASGKTAESAQIRAEIGSMVRAAFDAELQRVFENPGRVCARDKALAEGMLLRITRIAENIYAEQLQSEFAVFAVECDVGNRSIAPLAIPVEDGKSVRIRGRIDRLDVCRQENQTFFRIIDYKTGDKQFSYAKLMSGEHLQMILYEMAVESGGKGGFADLVPAGVLYYPATAMAFFESRNLSEQEKKEHIDANYCMNGIVVDERESLNRVRAMEKELRQHYVPVGLNAKNEIDDRSLRSDAEYKRIERYVGFQVRKMAKEVSSGGIQPVFMTDSEHCRYCKFSALCGRDVRIESVSGEKVSEQEARDLILDKEEAEWD